MDEAQEARIVRLAGPLAWAYYETLEPLDLAGLLTDYGGDARLVAADVLIYASGVAGQTAGEAPLDFKVGPIAIKLPGTSTADARNAEAWAYRAAELRAESRRARPFPAFMTAPIRPL